jgi:Abnormal spindle-like microcephaly-assoc'd, ASPM-SPD-2-Hydin
MLHACGKSRAMKTIILPTHACFQEIFRSIPICMMGFLMAGSPLSAEEETGGSASELEPAGKKESEIVVEQPVRSRLWDGKSKRSFGTVVVGQTGKSKTFKIKNLGNAKLSGLRVTTVGLHVGDFTVGPLKAVLVPQRKSTSFKVQFNPKAAGKRQATLRIFSNDPDENPFDITIVGEGVKPAK